MKAVMDSNGRIRYIDDGRDNNNNNNWHQPDDGLTPEERQFLQQQMDDAKLVNGMAKAGYEVTNLQHDGAHSSITYRDHVGEQMVAASMTKFRAPLEALQAQQTAEFNELMQRQNEEFAALHAAQKAAMDNAMGNGNISAFSQIMTEQSQALNAMTQRHREETDALRARHQAEMQELNNNRNRQATTEDGVTM